MSSVSPPRTRTFSDNYTETRAAQVRLGQAREAMGDGLARLQRELSATSEVAIAMPGLVRRIL